MYFTRESLATNRNTQSHWNDLWAVRNMMSANQEAMIAANRAHMTPEMLQANAAAGYAREFWQEVDRMVVTSREETIGMEILDDLMTIQTTLPIGKTVKSYNIGGNIAEDVSVSIDGQAPHSFDHTDYDSDGDPVPVFLAGFGVNWRHAAGLSSVGLDLVLDSQRAKMKVYNENLVSYLLDGKSTIIVDSKQGQGVRTHRNTKKVNLGASGVNIDLTTADQDQLITFFTTGAFATTATENYVTAYDVVWLSPQVMGNLSKPYNNGAVIQGTVKEEILRRGRIKEFRESFALMGNEFMGYERKQSSLTPLVGMNTGITPLPRPLPNTNYNFQILGAMGMQVKKDNAGRSGVIYGADMG
ncbi:major capsid protein [Vibrio casei]|uniref:Coat protein n=1 Tax=Vibrio casei TaxID=673372 RepID=A0A368LHD5_9VIBR|nr:major capsid protein [Vibrio casei]RCS70169.1 hypothetical protein CIK83_11945 [Vibrio casei]SJN24405.1 hypothetical protein FM109_05465 [Vibrio casei]